MDHLTQFPPNYHTRFYPVKERVPFKTEADSTGVRKFRTGDFYGITKGKVVKLQKDCPDAIVETKLSSNNDTRGQSGRVDKYQTTSLTTQVRINSSGGPVV